MRKILAIICLCVCLAPMALLGCKKSNKLALNEKYYITNIEFMGFSGDRKTVQAYLDSQDYVEEINKFSDYFDMALKIRIVFNSESSGQLIVPQLVAIFPTENTEIQNMIDEAREYGIINSSGDFIVNFDYKKTNDSIVVGTVHTKIIANDNDGDMSFVEALDKLAKYLKGETSSAQIKITNENANILKLKDGKLKMSLMVEYKSKSTNDNPDVATELLLTIAK